MDTENMKIRAGARLNFTITRADDEAVSATFIAVLNDEDNDATITATEEYDEDGVAHFQFDAPETDMVGSGESDIYDYQINENFESGSPDIYPNTDDCDSDEGCEFPTLEICESLSEGS